MLEFGYRLLRPLLFALDAETAHDLTLSLVSPLPSLVPRSRPPAAAARTFAGMSCPSPVGLAAGVDKGGHALLVWERLGFGFVEIGTITPRPQSGNPRPRVHRLKDIGAAVNSMGFPSEGAEDVRRRLSSFKERGAWPTVPVGVNLGKNKDTPAEQAHEDFASVAHTLRAFADYLVVNVSSPNTKGLRSLQQTDPLKRILAAVLEEANGIPVFVKLSPDGTPDSMDATIDAAVGAGSAGIIATNTTTQRPNGRGEELRGGLSGRPLFPIAKTALKHVVARCEEHDVPVIGVGGVSGPEEAKDYLEMGCCAVQLYTGLVFEGPGLPRRINESL